MTGVLNVDTIADNAGTGPVTLTKQSAAKAWTAFNPSNNTEKDSFNQSSRTDLGSGLSRLNFTNNMDNDDFATMVQTGHTNAPVAGSTGAYLSSAHLETTAKVEMGYGWSGDSSGRYWTLFDYQAMKAVVHGDLA